MNHLSHLQQIEMQQIYSISLKMKYSMFNNSLTNYHIDSKSKIYLNNLNQIKKIKFNNYQSLLFNHNLTTILLKWIWNIWMSLKNKF